MHRPGLPRSGMLRDESVSATTLMPTPARTAVLHRRIRLIVSFTIGYNMIECDVSVIAGFAIREGIEA